MSIFHSVNRRITEESCAQIEVLDLGLLRGYGVFDYVSLYRGRPFHLRAHLDRLCRSAKQVELELPMSVEHMEQAAFDLIEKNEPIDAGLRFIITGGVCGKDLLLPGKASSFLILFHPWTPYKEELYQTGMRAVTTSGLRYLPHVKTTNYMPAIFAMKKAVAAHADDALYLNREGRILEGTTSNIFFVRQGTLITDDSSEIVRGVTREIILNLAKNHYPIEYRALSLEEAVSCDEAFLTSSVKDAMPLVQIDDRKIGSGVPGPVSAHLRSLFNNYVEHYFHKQKVMTL